MWNDAKNGGLTEKMKNWEYSRENPCALLFELGKTLKSVQLPLYLALLEHDASCEAYRREGNSFNAALIELADKGQEHALFSGKQETLAEDHEKMLETIMVPIEFIVKHMRDATEFSPADDPKRCRNCPYSDICGR